MRRLSHALLYSVAMCVVVPHEGYASFMDMLGVGARAMSMGSAYTAVSDDVCAIYYNPAGLAQVATHTVLIGYLWSNPRLHASSAGDSDFHVRRVVPYHLKSPVVGLAFNLDSLFRDTLPVHVRIGVLNLTPDNFKSVYRHWDPEPATPRWFRYGDYWDRVHLEGALSIQPKRISWISLGAGFRFIISGSALMLDRYDMPGLTVELGGHGEGNTDLSVDTEATPTAGIMLYPVKGLRLGYCFRDSLSLVLKPMVTQAFVTIIPGKLGLPLQLSTSLEAYYFPQQHSLGISYQWPKGLLTSVDLSLFRWSRYAPASRGRLDPQWKDILIPRVGCEWRIVPNVALRTGYFFEPSPVPGQTKTSNYIDNDRHVVSLGVGYTCRDPLHIVREPITIDLVAQYIHLSHRVTTKAQGYGPSYESRGNVVSVAGNITLNF